MILHGRDSRPSTPFAINVSIPADDSSTGGASRLNKDARPFVPPLLAPPAFARLISTASGANSPPTEDEADVRTPLPETEEGEDVEMGEVDESGAASLEKPTDSDNAFGTKGSRKKAGKAKEDLEEGEASDASSELTDLSDLPGS